MTPVLLALVLVVLSCYCICRWRQATRSQPLPAGPLFNPLGSLFKRTSEQTSRYILQLKEKYGEVFCVRVMGTACVYLNSHKKIRQVFLGHGDVTSGRLKLDGIKHRLTIGRGLIFNDGFSWQEHRLFVLKTMKNFGVFCGGAEQIIENEVHCLLQAFDLQKGAPFDPKVQVNAFTCNITSWLLFGRRLGSEPQFIEIYETLRQRIEANNKLHHYVEVLLFKWITNLLPSSLLNKLMANENRIADYLLSQLSFNEENFNNNDDCLIDSYLREMNEDNYATFNREELLRTVVDMFIAGTDTTSSSLLWALLLMARHRQVQAAVHAELDEVLVGRAASSADRSRLVYTSAVLMEIQRYASVAPFGALPHRCTQDLLVDGYVIPRDSLIFANLFAAHRDEAIWRDPHRFNPLNFIDPTGTCLTNEQYLIPFSVGRRSCLGEAMAKRTLFILFVSLLQNFELSLPLDCLVTEHDCVFGNQRFAPNFRLIAQRRRHAV